MLEYIVLPKQEPLTMEEFCSTAPYSQGYGIAIDGFVKSHPRFEIHNGKPFFCLDHHSGVSRTETRATCAQALMNVRLGLFKGHFRKNGGGPHAHIYANDCDDDVCLTIWILLNPHRCQSAMNQRLNQLVHMVDVMDTTAGAYPFPEHLPSLRELYWTFDPYYRLRKSGGTGRKDAVEFRSVIQDCMLRIERFIAGKSEEIELECDFDVIERYPEWSLIREKGLHARLAVFNSGIDTFVSIRNRDIPGVHDCSIGRRSILVGPDFPSKTKLLNIAEAEARGIPLEDLKDTWGGSPTIMGSPRVSGTILDPLGKIAEIMNS